MRRSGRNDEGPRRKAMDVARRVLHGWRGGGMKLFRDLAVLTSGQVASRILGFLAFAWLARVLDPEGYGAIEYLAGMSVFFALLIEGGLSAIAIRRHANEPSALPRLALQVLVARLMLTAVAMPAMVLIAASGSRSALPPGLIWLFALSMVTAPWRQEWLFQATGRMLEAAFAQVLRMAVFAVAVWASVSRPQDLLAVGWAEIAAVSAMTGYCIYVRQVHITPFRLRGLMQGFRGLLTEGTTGGASSLVWALNQYAPLFLIAGMLGGAETAWFAAAARVVGALLFLSAVYHFSIYPAVARATARADDQLKPLLAGSFRVTAWAGVFAALALTVLAEPLTVIAFGAKMRPATPMLQIMAWMLPVTVCSGHARWALVAAGEQARVLAAQLVGLATTIGLALSLGPPMGGRGYAIAAVASLVATWVAAHLLAARSGCHPPPFHVAGKPALVALAVFALTRAVDAGPWLSLGALALFASAAPLLDRRLLPEIARLGRVTRVD